MLHTLLSGSWSYCVCCNFPSLLWLLAPQCAKPLLHDALMNCHRPCVSPMPSLLIYQLRHAPHTLHFTPHISHLTPDTSHLNTASTPQISSQPGKNSSQPGENPVNFGQPADRKLQLARMTLPDFSAQGVTS